MCYLLACVQCLTLMCGHSKYISSKIYLEIELMYKSLGKLLGTPEVHNNFPNLC